MPAVHGGGLDLNSSLTDHMKNLAYEDIRS
jgi:hypothetical protein